jgi:O-antigen ligase
MTAIGRLAQMTRLTASDSTRTAWRIVAAFSSALFCYSIIQGSLLRIAALAGGLLAVWISFRFPSVLILAVVLLGVPGFLPTALVESRPFATLFPVDIVVMVMVLASGLKALFLREDHRKRDGLLAGVLFLLGICCILQIARNYSEFGLSAPGEFRFRYFHMLPALYAATLLTSQIKRIHAFKVLLISSVGLGLVVFFVRLLANPASIFMEGHFTGGSISLGIAYGFAALWISTRYNLIGRRGLLSWVMALILLFVIVIDQHRSVWLAFTVLLIALVVTGDLPFSKKRNLGIGLLFAAAILTFLATDLGMRLMGHIGLRAAAFTSPANDPNALWRLMLWEAHLARLREFPFFGEGFGGYWQVFIPHFGISVDVAPHSFYVQTLVKLGAVGMALYAAMALCIVKRFLTWIRAAGKAGHKEMPLVLTALLVFIAGHFFYITYSMDYYMWIYTGLGLAVTSYSDPSGVHEPNG